MRLLTYANGNLVLRSFDSGPTPPYAILSHTWHTDSSKEVSFQDLKAGRAEGKPTYGKLLFCAQQAARDRLQYFWIDTCCIDQSSSAELTEALNSMFRWYQQSAKCYVYLSDVPNSQLGQEEAFRNTRWFSRGWTLQELIAPRVVEFFTADGFRLGNRLSLEAIIHDITGIATEALRGAAVSDFSIDERFSWAIHRQTKRPEDKAYCLLGIFDVSMPVIYGEGEEKATLRLHEHISKPTKFILSRLPQAEGAAFDSHANENEPKCHEDTRIDLLQQINHWVDDPGGKCIFWLYGIAGTGKSTVSRTVAKRLASKGTLSASFFFKRGEGDRGNASRFFTTIVAQLAIKLPKIVPHIVSALEADPNIALKSLETQCDKLMLDPLSATWYNKSSAAHKKTIILVDALDECEEERHVRTILGLLSKFRYIKGIDLRIFVTSRPELPIRFGFKKMDTDTHKDVGLHEIPEYIVDHDLRAVLASELEKVREEYSLQPPWPTPDELDALVSISRPLFIQAATICRFVSQRRLGNPRHLLKRILISSTSGSTLKHKAMYTPVLDQLIAGLNKEERDIILPRFRDTVGIIITLFEPLPKAAIANLVSMSTSDVDGILDYLHSVLRVPADEKLPIHLFHLSFHDFLVDRDQCDSNFWIDEEAVHSRIASKCIEIMSAKEGLRENICDLEYPGKPRNEVESGIIERCLSAELQYACRHWIAHMERGRRVIHDNDEIDKFLRKHFLHLLEALGLLGKISEAVDMIAKLQRLLDVNSSTECCAVLEDTRRFALAYGAAIDLAPLQVYAMLVFVPKESCLKRVFESQGPSWVSQVHGVASHWTSQLLVLEGQSTSDYTITYSPDGKQLASVSNDNAIRLWDAATSQWLGTFSGHSKPIRRIVYSPDAKQLASSSWDNMLCIWDIATGVLLWTLEGQSDSIAAMAYSSDGTQLILGSKDMTVQIWDATTGTFLWSRKGHSNRAGITVYSCDGKLVASSSPGDTVVQVWDVLTGDLQLTAPVECSKLQALARSLDGTQMALGLSDQTVQIRDCATGGLLQVLGGHDSYISAIDVSSEGGKLVSGSLDCKIRIFDIPTGVLLHTYEGHTSDIFTLAFSPDGTQVASGAVDRTVRIWDVTTSALQQTAGAHKYPVDTLAYAPNGDQVASGSGEGEVCIWDTATGALLFMFNDPNDDDGNEDDEDYEDDDEDTDNDGPIWTLAYSQDGKWLAWGSWAEIVLIHFVTTNALMYSMKGHNGEVMAIAFSPDGEQLVSGSIDNTVRIWDVTKGMLQQTLEGHNSVVRAVAYSPNGTQVVSGSNDMTLRIWDARSGALVRRFDGHRSSITATTFSPDGTQVVSASFDDSVRIWDAETGAVLKIFEWHQCKLSTIKYSPCGRYLVTDRGILYVTDTEICSTLLITDEWLLLEGLKTLWLPPDFRPESTAVHGSSITLGCYSGQVVMLRLRL